MRFDYTLLIGKIKSESSFSKVKQALGISYSTLSRRLSGEPLKTDEVLMIADLLDIDTHSSREMYQYFFSLKSSHLRTKQTKES